VPRKLESSVISSSSPTRLAEFAHESRRCGAQNIDVYTFRHRDVTELRKWAADKSHSELQSLLDANSTVAAILQDRNACSQAFEWLVEQLQDGPRIGGFATYLPSISSNQLKVRQSAIEALVNCIVGAIRTKKTLEGSEALGQANPAIIEIVGGSCVDVESGGKIRIEDRTNKIEQLGESINEVIDRVLNSPGVSAEDCWAIGTEIEPGLSYVLDSLESFGKLRKCLNEAAVQHCGVNLDIGHMMILEEPDKSIEDVVDSIVHTHVSDHPTGIHAKDWYIGAWNPVEICGSPFAQHLAKLSQRLAAESLPFSGCLALELEGCSRLSWVRASIGSLNYLLDRFNSDS